MVSSSRAKVPSVQISGAPAGRVLRGYGAHNRGVRLRVLQEQQPGRVGPVAGRFVLLDAGNNVNSSALAALAGRETDAAEVLAAARRLRPSCVSVANAAALALE